MWVCRWQLLPIFIDWKTSLFSPSSLGVEKQSTLGCQHQACVEWGCPGPHGLDAKFTPSFLGLCGISNASARQKSEALTQLWVGPKDQIWLSPDFRRKAAVSPSSHNPYSLLGSCGVRASVSSLTLGRLCGKGESLSLPKSPGLRTVG